MVAKSVIYFTASWCGPCQKIKPTFMELSKQFPDLSFTMIDVDQNGQLAEDYQVSGIPAFFFKMDDKIVSKFAGAEEKKLRAEVEKLANC